MKRQERLQQRQLQQQERQKYIYNTQKKRINIKTSMQLTNKTCSHINTHTRTAKSVLLQIDYWIEYTSVCVYAWMSVFLVCKICIYMFFSGKAEDYILYYFDVFNQI